MTKNIGGPLRYDLLAAIHKPKTRDQMIEAAAELARSGYSDYGIAAALKLSIEQVRAMLGEWRERHE